MQEFIEGKLTFLFPEDWIVLKYDDSKLHKRMKRVDDTKAVDFMALSSKGNGETLWIMEVKNPRGHESENKERITGGGLALEVAQKVRDSLAGLWVGCWTVHADMESMRPRFCRPLGGNVSKKVVLFLETAPEWCPEKCDYRKNLSDLLNKKLRWYGFRCLVYNMEELPKTVGWTVVHTAGSSR
ncbi:MAG: hypothetical protein HQL51_04725 [Magnetococcales bacterium]|nr:hypothetical protein [Magnetococcales bacterium]